MAYPGEAIGITTDMLNGSTDKFEATLTNGAVLELYEYCKVNNINNSKLVQILSDFDTKFVNNKTQSIIIKIQRFIETKNILKHNQKVPGVKNVDTLLQTHFAFVHNAPTLITNVNDVNENSECSEKVESSSPTCSFLQDLSTEVKQHVSMQTNFENVDFESLSKCTNLLMYENTR
ncbi:hypothetical protein DPMN_158165 [Dreissena polymorpha]|uniref:Uncharacterized protein n=1 Tax=Dreissena polymorpha TaxID=45954 RepID=A0A9D4IPI8_DREPO|nr:hypothetical protein DPMN_158165 [Dreissena polymorpha]